MKKLSFLLLLLITTYSAKAAVDLKTEFGKAIKAAGYNEKTVFDQSDSSKIKINEEPRFAFVNISGVKDMPTQKGSDYHAWFECYDGQGNYFIKRIILDAQGNFTLANFPKVNFAADFCDDEWIGDEVPTIRIGNWVKQDSYHFKAFYSDYLRGGNAQTGYRLYADIMADHTNYQQRGGVEDPSKKALCFPEGFPCAVYLNGKFYGLFSWQLKKHRDNMDMKKKTAEHIHLDGTLADDVLFGGTINWTAFEVRNPKKLYTQTGEPYDGDNPTELMDEKSPFFDPANEDHVRSATTKSYIVALSKYKGELDAIAKEGSKSKMRSEIAKRFDDTCMMDYLSLALVQANYDAFRKNWQWFTYDGKKWFLAPYDVDCVFGIQFHGTYSLDARYSNYLDDYKMRALTKDGPCNWFFEYYFDDLKKRYAQLRNSGVLTAEHIMEYIYDWQERVGQEMYDKEFKAWPESYCINEMIPNTHWSTTDDWTGYENVPDYSWSKNYVAGDKVWYRWRIWTATGSSKGEKPGKQLGYLESVSRIHEWIGRRFELEDDYLGYSPAAQSSYTLTIPSFGSATVCVPFDFNIPSGTSLYSVKTANGGYLQLTAESAGKANKPYVIQGKAGSYKLSGKNNKDSNLVNGLLHGTYSIIYVPADSYVLQENNGQAGFYRVKESNSMTIGANKAYLMPDSKNSAALRDSYLLEDVEYPTYLVDIDTDEDDLESIYSPTGVQLNELQPGLNIIIYKDGSQKKVWCK